MIDLVRMGAMADEQVERLWPNEGMAERVNCLVEEVGEVSRALTKRRHAVRDGSCKGMTAEEWTANLRAELGQVLLVALTIANREMFDMEEALREQVDALERMNRPMSLAEQAAAHAASGDEEEGYDKLGGPFTIPVVSGPKHTLPNTASKKRAADLAAYEAKHGPVKPSPGARGES